ncbi:MAG: PocR ligand-binding domain-containing protein [Bacillales bacterium]|nr:PocR ligand-binding domain-containing protein [Bacillales bacterium]
MTIQFYIEKLQELLKAFHTLTGLRIVVYDSEYHEIASYPRFNCAFCSRIQSSVDGKSRCDNSNKASFDYCQKHKELYTYHCHAGLVESMIHLKKDDRIVGYIMFGQISDIADTAQRVIALSKLYKDMEEEIVALPYKTNEEIQSASVILLTLAKYTVNEQIVRINKDQFILQLEDIIHQNIDNSDLNVNMIAKKMNVCKTTLYNFSTRYLHMGIAKYITKIRIIEAKKLLQNLELPIVKICYYIGFNDYNYFSRLFKKEVGMTCTEYRQKYIKDLSISN